MTDDRPEVLVLPDPAAVSVAAAERVRDGLAAAIGARGVAHWATTGGSSPAGMYAAIRSSARRDAIDWRRVHLWWGDDRFVPRDDPRCNVLSAETGLLGPDGVPIPPGNVHAWPTDAAIRAGTGPAAAAAAYASEVGRFVAARDDGTPVFDVMVVGIGPDGHLLSVFPGSAAFDTDVAAIAIAVPAPTQVGPHVERVTFTPRVLDAAGRLLAIATGAGKAEVLGKVFGPLRDERRWPAQRALRSGATWLLDAAAAAGLPTSPASR